MPKTAFALFLILFLCGCSSPKTAFYFSLQKFAARPGIAEPAPEDIPSSHSENPAETVAFLPEKVPVPFHNLPATKPAKQVPRPYTSTATGLSPEKHLTRESEISSQKEAAALQPNVLNRQRSGKFPGIFFLVLTAVLVGLFYLIHRIEKSSPQGPPVHAFLYLLLIPALIFWLYLAFKGLALLVAPLLGWPVFWTGIALFVLVLGLLKLYALLADNIRKKRITKKLRKMNGTGAQ